MHFVPNPARAAVLAVMVVGSIVAGASPAGADVGRERVERNRAIRAALHAPEGHATAMARLDRRAAPSSLSLLVVGCDFSDSLMVGRDRSQFPGWPDPRRKAQEIPPRVAGLPPTGIPMFEAHDEVYFDLQMERVNDYFRTVSFDRFRLEWDVHPEIVNLPGAMGYYGAEDSASVRAVRMAKQVVDRIDDDVDFARYDTLVLIHAGAGQETDVDGDSRAQIFSNYLDRRDFERAVEADYLDEPFLATGEIPVEHVLVLPEAQSQDPIQGRPLSGFLDVRGVYAFELGLRMGMLSLADFTPGSFPDSQGIGNFGLMGYGLFTGLGTVPSAPSAMNRYLMGWVDAVDVREDADLRIGAMDSVGAAASDTLLVRVPITEREYWLVEFRLQDPNGDLFYTFADSFDIANQLANADRLPEFYDADSDSGDGTPTSPYDPTEDTWEDEYGAEFDWFMSENDLRTPDGCQRAGGSGLYVWHVDERVIQDALLAGTNTINADASRKGVDVEEADGIQDLDSLAGGEYLLGADADAWRGPDVAAFGPNTFPNTDSNDGLPTGIRFHDFSSAALDTLPKIEFQGRLFCSGFVYRRAMTFSVDFDARADGPAETARWRADGYGPRADLRALDLGTDVADATLDGALELIAVADSGRVLAWSGDLQPWSGSSAVLARAPGGTAPTGPPALVDLDGDARPEIAAAFEEAVFAFDVSDGALVSPDDAPASGAWIEAEGAGIGPFVAIASGEGLRAAWLDDRSDGPRAARIATTSSAPTSPTRSAVPLGDGSIDEAAVIDGDDAASDRFVVVARDSSETVLRAFAGDGTALRSVPLENGLLAGTLVGLRIEGDPAVAWVDEEGFVHLAGTDRGDRDAVSLEAGRPASRPVVAPSSDGGPVIVAVSLAGALHVLDANLRTRFNFPYRVDRDGAAPVVGPRVTSPVLVDLTGDGRTELLWHEPAGSIHAVDLDGRAVAGWPVAGPAESASSPVVADLDGDGAFDLAVAGRFGRLVSIDAPDQTFAEAVVGEVRVFDLDVPTTAFASWTQGGGGVDNRVRARLDRTGAAPADGRDLVLYPNPTLDGLVRVRFPVRETADVRVEVFTLEGERVLELPPVRTFAGDVFEEVVDLSGVVGGMYLCAIEAGGRSERAVLLVVR